MLPRRLYSSFSRGSGAIRSGLSGPNPSHSPSASASATATASGSAHPTRGSSGSTRGRFRPARAGVRARANSSSGVGLLPQNQGAQWVSELLRGPMGSTSRAGSSGIVLRADPLEAIDALLARPGGAGASIATATRGRKRPFARTTGVTRLVATSSTQGALGSNTYVQHPIAKDYTFRPIPLSPVPLYQHLAFNPAHVPIPANLGTAIYDRPRVPRSEASENNSTEDLFSAPSPPSPARALNARVSGPGSGLGEHLSVISALSHPAFSNALYQPPSTSPDDGDAQLQSYSSYGMVDPENHLVRTLAEADTKNQIFAEQSFARAMAHLGLRPKRAGAGPGVSASAQGVEQAEQAQMTDALQGVDALLARLEVRDVIHEAEVEAGADVEDLHVNMDSVRRKRKKKISKHKYQKRRKAQRAQRKRLGK